MCTQSFGEIAPSLDGHTVANKTQALQEGHTTTSLRGLRFTIFRLVLKPARDAGGDVAAIQTRGTLCIEA